MQLIPPDNDLDAQHIDEPTPSIMEVDMGELGIPVVIRPLRTPRTKTAEQISLTGLDIIVQQLNAIETTTTTTTSTSTAELNTIPTINIEPSNTVSTDTTNNNQIYIKPKDEPLPSSLSSDSISASQNSESILNISQPKPAVTISGTPEVVDDFLFQIENASKNFSEEFKHPPKIVLEVIQEEGLPQEQSGTSNIYPRLDLSSNSSSEPLRAERDPILSNINNSLNLSSPSPSSPLSPDPKTQKAFSINKRLEELTQRVDDQSQVLTSEKKKKKRNI